MPEQPKSFHLSPEIHEYVVDHGTPPDEASPFPDINAQHAEAERELAEAANEIHDGQRSQLEQARRDFDERPCRDTHERLVRARAMFAATERYADDFGGETK